MNITLPDLPISCVSFNSVNRMPIISIPPYENKTKIIALHVPVIPLGNHAPPVVKDTWLVDISTGVIKPVANSKPKRMNISREDILTIPNRDSILPKSLTPRRTIAKPRKEYMAAKAQRGKWGSQYLLKIANAVTSADIIRTPATQYIQPLINPI